MILKSHKLSKRYEIKVTFLLINTQKPIVVVAILLVINLVVASLVNYYVYYNIDVYLYEQYNDYLIEVKQITHQEFQHAPHEKWQDKATLLANKFDSECNIIVRDNSMLDDSTLLMLARPQSGSGFVDMDNAIVYYPLNDKFVVELGPIGLNTWLTFISEWFSWIIAISLNLLLVFLYLTVTEKQRKKLTQTILDLPFEFRNKNKGIYLHIKELSLHISELHHNNESRLLLQRDLLHGVAHEFRSPMARIQFALDMLEEATEAEQGALRQSIQTSLEDLDKLVKELLYYAKLKNTESVLTFTTFNPETLCESAIAQVCTFYPDINFVLNNTDVEHSVIKADENLIKRMLINLLRNAGRFAHSTCIITITSTNNAVDFIIEDDGVGIPPGKTKRIFEPFTRLDPSRSRDSGGCGLGLAIVDSIVNKHQGKIALINGKLSGACFKITLPKTSDV
jgi:two-component system sensor histidine kinase RstB